MWKGEAATAQVKRKRAQRMFAIDGKVCEEEGCELPAQHRHHLNEDPGDNRLENIGFYCARHHLLIHASPELPKTCQNCGRDAKPCTKGLCKTCYAYRRRTGRSRPWATDGRREGSSVYHPRPAKGPVACSNCGKATKPAWQGRCRRCYDYWRNHGFGVERAT